MQLALQPCYLSDREVREMRLYPPLQSSVQRHTQGAGKENRLSSVRGVRSRGERAALLKSRGRLELLRGDLVLEGLRGLVAVRLRVHHPVRGLEEHEDLARLPRHVRGEVQDFFCRSLELP